MDSEYVLIPKQELVALRSQQVRVDHGIAEHLFSMHVNQKELSRILKWSEPTVISWKKKGLLPVEQLPGSRKCTYNVGEVKLALRKFYQAKKTS